MGLARVRDAMSTYVMFSSFYVVIILVFSAGWHPLVCETFWPDRLWYLFLIIPFSGVASMVNFARQQPGDFDAEWWARWIHNFVTFLLLVFFTVMFLAYLLPAMILANCQPGDVAMIAGVCTGGKCNNPFNDPAWFCIYNNTAEAALCELPPCMSTDLCSVAHDPALLESAFAHFWLFAFVIVLIVLGMIDLVLMWNLHGLSARMRLVAHKDRGVSSVEQFMPISAQQQQQWIHPAQSVVQSKGLASRLMFDEE